jgi:DNA-binding ferritin-like protein
VNILHNMLDQAEADISEVFDSLAEMYTCLVQDADLMRQINETHPLKQAIRSFERTYLGRTEG